MEFSEKLIQLRRQKGWSQEQLAERLDITRQSVSKWESGAAWPEVSKLIALSDLFGVSVDYLVKACEMEPGSAARMEGEAFQQQIAELSRLFRGYSYDSKTKLFGIPLLSIRLRFYLRPRSTDVARGIFAIGNIAVGVVSLGMFSVGLLSLGVLCVGALALGVLAMGLAALGVVSIGVLALGVCALGMYAGGVAALGREIAVGIAAVGNTAVGRDVSGSHTLLWSHYLTHAQVEAFLRLHHPDLWPWLLSVLSAFAV